MSCCQHFDYFEPTDGGARSFTVQMPRTTFGRGAVEEVGPRLAMQGFERVALITDAYLRDGEQVERARRSLADAGVGFHEFSEIRIEPSDRSVMEATAFLKTDDFDAVVSIGGGSVIDTAKAAMVYAAYPAPFTNYFAPPVGDGQPVPGPLPYHLACPTTGGTGSEATGVAVIRITDLDTKFVLQSPYLIPDETVIDPEFARSLPSNVSRFS